MASPSKRGVRRDQVAQLLHKSVPVSEISTRLKLSEKTVYNDIRWMHGQSNDWLTSLTKSGFIYECMIAIDKFKTIEHELRVLLDGEEDTMKQAKILHELAWVINMEVETLGNGPTLMALRRADGRFKGP